MTLAMLASATSTLHLQRAHVRHRDHGTFESAAEENGVMMSPTLAFW